MHQNKNIEPTLFTTSGHFNEEGLSLYAEAIHYQRLDKLPPDMLAHATDCTQCKTDAVEVSEIISLSGHEYPEESEHPFFGKVHSYQADNKPEKVKKRRLGYLLMKFAAALLLIVGSAFVIYFLLVQNGDVPVPPVVENTVQAADSLHSNDSVEHQPLNKEKNKEPEKQSREKQEKIYHVEKEILADVYKPNNELDKLVVGQTRALDFEMISPKSNARFNDAGSVRFQWRFSGSEAITIKIMDNLGKTKIQESTPDTFLKMNERLRPGLYYWFAGTDEDMLAGGKFEIRK
jgi:hypothetical protein